MLLPLLLLTGFLYVFIIIGSFNLRHIIIRRLRSHGHNLKCLLHRLFVEIDLNVLVAEESILIDVDEALLVAHVLKHLLFRVHVYDGGFVFCKVHLTERTPALILIGSFDHGGIVHFLGIINFHRHVFLKISFYEELKALIQIWVKLWIEIVYIRCAAALVIKFQIL